MEVDQDAGRERTVAPAPAAAAAWYVVQPQVQLALGLTAAQLRRQILTGGPHRYRPPPSALPIRPWIASIAN